MKGNFATDGQIRFLEYLKAATPKGREMLKDREFHMLTHWEADELLNIVRGEIDRELEAEREKARRAKAEKRRVLADKIADKAQEISDTVIGEGLNEEQHFRWLTNAIYTILRENDENT